MSVGHHLRLQIKSKIDNTMCKLNVMLRFVEKGRLLSTVGRPFLIIKTFGRLKIYSYICIEH